MNKAVSVADGVPHIVGDHQGGELLLRHHPLRQLHDLGGGLGVQRRRMLVQQQQLRLAEGGHQQRQRLPLAAGEGAYLGRKTGVQPQSQLLEPLPVLLPLRLADAGPQSAPQTPAGRQCQIFLDLHPGGGAGHGILIHPAQILGPLVLRQGGEVDPVQKDLPRIRQPCAADGVLHGALPGAVAADDGDEVPVVEGEGQIVEGDLLIHGTGIEDLGHMAHFKHDGSLL